MRNVLFILFLSMGMAAMAQDRLEPIRELTKEEITSLLEKQY